MNDDPIAALYLRSAAASADAIAEQRRICAEYAAARGWSVGEVFVDDGVSGTTDQRPGLDALRVCLRERRPVVVIATAPDRISRDPLAVASFIRSCTALGVEIAYADFHEHAAAAMQSMIEACKLGSRQLRARRTAP